MLESLFYVWLVYYTGKIIIFKNKYLKEKLDKFLEIYPYVTFFCFLFFHSFNLVGRFVLKLSHFLYIILDINNFSRFIYYIISSLILISYYIISQFFLLISRLVNDIVKEDMSLIDYIYYFILLSFYVIVWFYVFDLNIDKVVILYVLYYIYYLSNRLKDFFIKIFKTYNYFLHKFILGQVDYKLLNNIYAFFFFFHEQLIAYYYLRGVCYYSSKYLTAKLFFFFKGDFGKTFIKMFIYIFKIFCKNTIFELYFFYVMYENWNGATGLNSKVFQEFYVRYKDTYDFNLDEFYLNSLFISLWRMWVSLTSIQEYNFNRMGTSVKYFNLLKYLYIKDKLTTLEKYKMMWMKKKVGIYLLNATLDEVYDLDALEEYIEKNKQIVYIKDFKKFFENKIIMAGNISLRNKAVKQIEVIVLDDLIYSVNDKYLADMYELQEHYQEKKLLKMKEELHFLKFGKAFNIKSIIFYIIF